MRFDYKFVMPTDLDITTSTLDDALKKHVGLPLETFAQPTISKGSGDNLVRNKMQSVYDKELKPKGDTGRQGNNDSPRENKKRGGGTSGFPKRLEKMIQLGIDQSYPSVLTELIEVLVQYSLALLDHNAEKEGIRSESKSAATTAKMASAAVSQKEFGGAGNEVERPLSREIGSKERSMKWQVKEHNYQTEQIQRLQRCAHLYSQVLFENVEWEQNVIEGQNVFEKLYGFIVKVVLSCVKERQETGEARPKNGTQTSARPSSIVEEELGRLFRSSIFNTRARRRERIQFSKFREEATDEDKRFQMDDSGGKGGRGGQDKELNQSGSTKGASSSIDAIIARFRQRATSRRSRPSKAGKEGMQYAASARSPMIASLLPSAREKMLEVHNFRCHQMGLPARNGNSDLPMLSNLRTPPMSPRRSPKKEQMEELTPFENKWALRSGRARIIHDRRMWKPASGGSPRSAGNAIAAGVVPAAEPSTPAIWRTASR